MKKILLFIVLLAFPLFAMAQASGGQITRKRSNPSAKTQKQSQGSKPRSNQAKPSSSSRNVVKISEPDGYINGHGYVDLGLPSGTKWATCNIGAISPEQHGDYFAWGETNGFNNGKTETSWSTYKWCNGSSKSLTKYNTEKKRGIVDNKTELDLEDDAAYVNWGAEWRMPSIEQFWELIDHRYTSTMATKLRGLDGLKIKSKKNGHSLFLPLADFSSTDHGIYWSRSLSDFESCDACYLVFDLGFPPGSNCMYRYLGHSVRPVLSNK